MVINAKFSVTTALPTVSALHQRSQWSTFYFTWTWRTTAFGKFGNRRENEVEVPDLMYMYMYGVQVGLSLLTAEMKRIHPTPRRRPITAVTRNPSATGTFPERETAAFDCSATRGLEPHCIAQVLRTRGRYQKDQVSRSHRRYLTPWSEATRTVQVLHPGHANATSPCREKLWKSGCRRVALKA